MSKRNQVVDRLRAIEPRFSEVAYGFDRNGEPTVESGGPSVADGLLTRTEIEKAIQFLQTYLDICPDDRTVAHSDMRYCGSDSCVECYARERSRARYYFFLDDEMNATRQWSGFVCLVKVGERFHFCASGDPNKKARELSRAYSEPVKVVGTIRSNHQMLSKLWWLRASVDYLIPNSQFFQLPENVVLLFNSQLEHVITTENDHQHIMGPVEEYLNIPTNLPKLLELPYHFDTMHEEEIWKALKRGLPLP